MNGRVGRVMKKWKKELFEWLIALAIGIIIITLIRSTVLTTYHIEGDSMLPTLQTNDQVLVLRNTSIDYGDIVILDRPNDSDIVKRVIGLPGDRIEFKNSVLYLNGEALEEDYIASDNYVMKDQLYTVSANSLFVLGDNRDKSLDSRQLGEFTTDQIIGEVKVIYFPFQHFQWISY